MSSTRRMVILALCIAIASILHVVETWLPVPMPLPGAKLGLANIVSLFVILLYGWRDALSVAVVRVWLGSVFGGALLGPAFLMSISGTLASTWVMAYTYSRWPGVFSLIGISIIGAVTHNVAQLFMATILVSNLSVLWYLPYLFLFALPTGVAVGYGAAFFLTKLTQATNQRNKYYCS